VGNSLIFHSLTVHEALPNVTADRMRVSLDNRYQTLKNPITEQMLVPHLSIDGEPSWDEIYADWESEELQYYGKKLDMTVVLWDTGFGEKGFA
jgi:hypothetical protein